MTSATLIGFLVIASVIATASLTVVAQQNSEKAAVAKVNDDARYRIGAGDVLSVLVRKAPELSIEAVRVDQRGMIRIPMVDDEVQAACMTESDLAAEIATLYLEFKKSPNVAVYVREYQSRPVAVIGAVTAPGQFRLQRRVRLLELLTFAGGHTPRAGRIIDVIHAGENNKCEGTAPEITAAINAELPSVYKLEETLKGKDGANPFVQAGDIVSLPEADQVFIMGHVLAPQAISLRDKPITLSRAVAMAGGPARDASTSKVRIIRQTASGEKQELIVDLGKILKRKAEDVVLIPDDIIDVPSSTGKTILSALTGAIAPTLANVPIRMIP